MNGNGWPVGAWRWCLVLLAAGLVGGYFIGAAVELQRDIDRGHLAAGIEQLLTGGTRND